MFEVALYLKADRLRPRSILLLPVGDEALLVGHLVQAVVRVEPTAQVLAEPLRLVAWLHVGAVVIEGWMREVLHGLSIARLYIYFVLGFLLLAGVIPSHRHDIYGAPISTT